jgi:hypothetical protein
MKTGDTWLAQLDPTVGGVRDQDGNSCCFNAAGSQNTDNCGRR